MKHDPMERLLGGLDRLVSGASRLLANRTSRRSFLGRLGASLAGVAAFPMLPVLREAAAAADVTELGDPNSCEYWRYCAFSGTLCGCCGGSNTQCPPGAETASVAWVGTCHNPADGKDYLVSYNDCCGKSTCGRCGCHRSEGDKPVYFPSKSNSILWCFGASSHAYHCTLALVIGEADSTVVG
ncbi:MAG: methylamine dehydrogenase light chain [Pseudomonadales bacterium]|jgi:methylamine dehydrogenase light chain|nr:methylamine dehydrogenase light chain [Pseudomonadales bacterium]